MAVVRSRSGRMGFVALAVAALAGLTFVQSSRAALLYDINSTGEGSAYSGYAGNWGFQFNVSGVQTISVASLGLWDEGKAAVSTPITVGLINVSTGGQLIATESITSSSIAVASTASNVGQWLFTDLATPITLSPDSTYDLMYLNDSPSNQNTALMPFRAGVTPTFLANTTYATSEDRSNSRSSLVEFGLASGSAPADGWFGANLSTTPFDVPEPATLSVATLAAAGLLLRRRRRSA